MVKTRSSDMYSSGAKKGATNEPERVEDAESSKADRGATSENDSEESQVLEVQKVEKGSKNKRKAPRKGKTAKKAKARVRMSSNAPDSDPEGSTEEIERVYHHTIRDELIAAAARLGSYDHPQERGLGHNDITSFLPSQKHWGPKRANYPDIIFQYKPPAIRHPEYELELWYHRGRLVVDWENNPISRWRNIPDVLSSKFPGYAMEAIERMDNRITHRTFLQRMPITIQAMSKGKAVAKDRPKTNVLAARMSRFRQQAGCLAWNDKVVSDIMLGFLEEHLPEHLKHANTTRGFRDLEKYEIAGLQVQNVGKYANRSRHKIPVIRENYVQGVKDRYYQLRAAHEEALASAADAESVHTEDAHGESDSLDAARFLDYHAPARHFQFNILDEEDCRNHRPETEQEQADIQHALEATYEDYQSLTGVLPQLERPSESYAMQWQYIQDQCDRFHIRGEYNRTPLLLAVAKWIGGTGNWRSSPYIHELEVY